MSSDHIYVIGYVFNTSNDISIRTPLNTSSIGLQLALNELGKKTYDTEDNLRAALAAVEEATEILNDLLLADKLDSGHMIAEREEIDVMSIVRKTFHIFNVQVPLCTLCLY